MKKLLVLIAGLLLAGPALADPGRGELSHCPTSDLATCTPQIAGTSVYDTTTSQIKTYNGTAWAAECNQVLWGVADPTEAQVTPDFIDPRDNAGSTTEGNEDNFLMPATGNLTAWGLACTVDVAPGAVGGVDIWTITLRTGTPGALADSSVTCQITNTETTCSDATNSVALAATDAITIGIESDDGASAPTAAAAMDCRFCLGY